MSEGVPSGEADDPESQSEIADAVEVVANDLVAFHSPLSATGGRRSNGLCNGFVVVGQLKWILGSVMCVESDWESTPPL
jgi:hypothetical protein